MKKIICLSLIAINLMAYQAGTGASATGGYNLTAVGDGASANNNDTTAVGSSASATSASSTAVGSNASATGSSSTALGYFTKATGSSSTALGAYASATGVNSTVVGSSAFARAEGSVAIGVGSLVYDLPDQEYVVSFGNHVENGGSDYITRRLINISAPINDHDAVNLIYLKSNFYDRSFIDTNYYNKSTIDNSFINYYNKSEIDAFFTGIGGGGTTINNYGVDEAIIDDKDNQVLANANSYTDASSATTLANAKTYTDTTNATTLANANSYSDMQDIEVLKKANNYSDNLAKKTLSEANSYTDSKISALEESLTKEYRSATATAIALGVSPILSNGNKSAIGIGLGHYEGQNAVAVNYVAEVNKNVHLQLGTSLNSNSTALKAGVSFGF